MFKNLKEKMISKLEAQASCDCVSNSECRDEGSKCCEPTEKKISKPCCSDSTTGSCC